MIRLSLFSIASLATLPICAQQCEAPSDVKAAIQAALQTPAAAKSIREQFPTDYFAHRFYQERSFSQGLFSQAVVEEYRTLLDAHPDDLLYEVLYARVLVGTNTPEALRLLHKVLTRDLNYPPARLKLVEIYSAPAFRDNEKLAANADSFWQACPDSLSAYSYATRIEDVEFNARAAARLRKLLQGRTDSEALGLYNTLWSMEFKAVPLSEQEPTRERVRKDAEFLRSQDLAKNGFLLNTLSQAYKLAGDAEGTKWVEAEQVKNGTPGASAASAAIIRWRKANPYNYSSFGREAYQEKLLKQTEEWIHQWPDDPQPRYERFQALRMMRDAPLEDTVSAAEDWMRIYEKHPGSMSPYQQVAQYFAMHNVRFAELPDLLERGVKETQRMRPAARHSDLYPINSQSGQQQLGSLSALNSAAGAFLKIRKYDRARELLSQIGPAGDTQGEASRICSRA
jgi:hypothetical protein